MLIALAASGCAGPLNQSSRLGDPSAVPPIDTLEPTASAAPDYHDPAYTPRRLSDSSSLTGMDRSNWAAREFLVPVHAVEHQPNYTYHAQYTTFSARQRGEHPSADTALEKFPPAWNKDQPAEAAMGPIWSALDVLMFVPRAVMTPPWSTTQSPRWAYERTPHDRPASTTDAAVEIVPGGVDLADPAPQSDEAGDSRMRPADSPDAG